MDTRLYVGNLHLTLDSYELSQLFEEYGTVRSAEIVTNRQTGQSRGFGFVEMSCSEEAQAATLALDGEECIGRILSVRPADLEDELPEAQGPRAGAFGAGVAYGPLGTVYRDSAQGTLMGITRENVMSRICDHCGTQIRGFFTHTTPIVRHEDATGYTYRFCSETCANQWTAQRAAVPRPSSRPDAARVEEDRQVDQRWLAEGGATGPGT